eukprot:TRINITY_DN1553_c0_g1_i3.p1 TRINITY_DN1553_c0_g1~~TRINITY_DN1553_c0_g1_i3.p1  ORF type:complete len:179 (-),score=32.07 TRINITY_DN1553_c0_g1_i3:117-653(-)
MYKLLWVIFAIYAVYRVFAVVFVDIPVASNCNMLDHVCTDSPVYCMCEARKALHMDLTKYVEVDPLMASNSLQIKIICGVYAYFVTPAFILYLLILGFKKNIASVFGAILSSTMIAFMVPLFIAYGISSVKPALVIAYNSFDLIFPIGLLILSSKWIVQSAKSTNNDDSYFALSERET